ASPSSTRCGSRCWIDGRSPRSNVSPPRYGPNGSGAAPDPPPPRPWYACRGAPAPSPPPGGVWGRSARPDTPPRPSPPLCVPERVVRDAVHRAAADHAHMAARRPVAADEPEHLFGPRVLNGLGQRLRERMIRARQAQLRIDGARGQGFEPAAPSAARLGGRRL